MRFTPIRMSAGEDTGMRVAYDVSPVFGGMAGIGHYSAMLLHSLAGADRGLDLRPYAITAKSGGLGLPEGLPEPRHLRVPARLAVTAWTRLGFPPGEILTGEADLVHGTNFWLPPLKGRNGVVTIHDLTFQLYPELCTPQIRRYRWIVPRALEWASMVITPSQVIADQVRSELEFPGDRIAVTYEGVRGVFNSNRPAGDVPYPKPYVVFVGTREPRKNLGRLLQALKVLPSVTLVLVGAAGWGEPIEVTADRVGVGDRVVVPGYLPDQRLAQVVSSADAFVFPSIYEGFGLPPLEAMAAGVPVVAAKAGSLPEILGDAPFWCDPLDPSSIAGSLESALKDEATRAAAIEKGHERAAAFTWDKCAQETLDVYARAAGS